MATISKRDRLLNALRSGKKLTIDQIVSRFKFAHRDSAWATISTLRGEFYPIVNEKNRKGVTVYSYYTFPYTQTVAA